LKIKIKKIKIISFQLILLEKVFLKM